MGKIVIAMAVLGTLAGCGKKVESPSRPNVPSKTEGAERPVAKGVACGENVCAPGMECCNESCGICAPPGSDCTREVCDDERHGEPAPPPPEPDGTAEPSGDQVDVSCENLRCAKGYHCEMVEVQCVRAPCHPVAECKPD